MAPFPEPRKHIVNLIQRCLPMSSGVRKIRSYFKVIFHRQAGEKLPPFRDEHDS